MWYRNGVLSLWPPCARLLQHHDESQENDYFCLMFFSFLVSNIPLASINHEGNQPNTMLYSCRMGSPMDHVFPFLSLTFLLLSLLWTHSFLLFSSGRKDVLVHVHPSTQSIQSIFPFTPFLKKHTIVPLSPSPQPFPPFSLSPCFFCFFFLGSFFCVYFYCQLSNSRWKEKSLLSASRNALFGDFW